MSKFNRYAKELDAAFRAARDGFAGEYERVKGMRNAISFETDALKKQHLQIDLQHAEKAFKSSAVNIWGEFDRKAAAIRKELEEEIRKNSIVSPESVDNNALELMKAGAMTADDYESFSERFADNPTMLKLVRRYAEEAAKGAADRRDSARLNMVAHRCMTPKEMDAFDNLHTVANYCSGRGHSGNRNDGSPEFVVSMGKQWEELSANTVENF